MSVNNANMGDNNYSGYEDTISDGAVWVKIEATDPVVETPEQEEGCVDDIDIQLLCRMCAQNCSRSLATSIHSNPTLIAQLNAYFDIEIKYGDGMPDLICNVCAHEIEHWESLKSKIQVAQITLEEKIQKIQNPFVRDNIEEIPRDVSETGDLDCVVEYSDSSDSSETIVNSNLKTLNDQDPDYKNQRVEVKYNSRSYNFRSGNESRNETVTQNIPKIRQSKNNTISNKKYKKVKVGCKYRIFPIRSLSPTNPYVCGTCPSKLKTELQLTVHMNDHYINGTKSFFCAHCNVWCKSIYHLVKHQTAHVLNPSEKISYTCLYCTQEFPTKSNLKLHVDNMHKNTEKKIDDKYNNTPTKNIQRIIRKIPIRSHSPNHPYLCSICPQKFKRSLDFENHLEIHKKCNIRLIFCAHCNIKSKSIKHLIIHQKQHILDPNIKICYNCLYCDDAFITKSNLNLHIKNVHKKEFDILNNKNVNLESNVEIPELIPISNLEESTVKNNYNNLTTVELQKDIPSSEKKFIPYFGTLVPCSACNIKFKNYKFFVNHFKDHTDKQRNQIYQCLYCGNICENEENYIQHIKNHLGPNLNVKRYRTSNKPHNKRVLCPICGKIITQPVLPAHLESHTGERNYKCNLCAKAFKTQSTLQCHMRTHVKNRPTYQCYFCDRIFNVKHPLQIHIMSHLNYKPFKCSICPNEYTTISKLKRHSKTHYGDLHYCIKCKKGYKDITKCRKHMRLKCNVAREDMPYKRLV